MYTATRAALVIKCKMAGVGEEVETLGNTVVHSGEEEARQPLWKWPGGSSDDQIRGNCPTQQLHS